MVFVDRRPRKDDRWLTLKMWSFSLGAVIAVVGMATEIEWLIWVAVGVLAVGFAARFFRQGEDGEEEDEGERIDDAGTEGTA